MLEHRAELRKNCLQDMSHYSWDVAADEVEVLYRSMVRDENERNKTEGDPDQARRYRAASVMYEVWWHVFTPVVVFVAKVSEMLGVMGMTFVQVAISRLFFVRDDRAPLRLVFLITLNPWH